MGYVPTSRRSRSTIFLFSFLLNLLALVWFKLRLLISMAVLSRHLQPRAYVKSRSTGPKFDHDSIKFIIVDAILVILATLAVILRFLARRIKRSPFYLEDYMVLVALVRTLVCSAVLSAPDITIVEVQVSFHYFSILSETRQFGIEQRR